MGIQGQIQDLSEGWGIQGQIQDLSEGWGIQGQIQDLSEGWARLFRNKKFITKKKKLSQN